MVVLYKVGLVSRQHFLLAGLISAFCLQPVGYTRKIIKVPQTLKFIKLLKVNKYKMAIVVNN